VRVCRDEDPIGTWSLRVRDQVKDEHNGTFISWTMQLWGSSIDPKKATLWQLPSDPSDSPPPEETQAPIIPPTAAATKTLVRPTAHLPEDHASAPGETHVLVPPPTSTDPYGDEGIDVDDSDDPFSDISPYVPGRVSKLLNSSTWVFVALGTIIVSVGASLAFFWMRSRKGARGGIRGGGYDFAPTTDDEDGIGLRMRRSGEERGRTLELYDAFALPEEEEEEGKYGDEAVSRSFLM
jgi:kexin